LAAKHLNATQSAVSKRVLELEGSLGVKLFESINRTQLTLKGREILGDLEKMLELQRNIMLRVSDEAMYAGLFRLGVSEMVALTWLPTLVGAVKRAFPRLVLEPSVNLTSVLWTQMRNQRLDMIICPLMGTEESGFSSTTLGIMSARWMCKPGLLPAPDERGRHSLQTMQRQPLLTYSEGSRLHLELTHLLQQAGAHFDQVIYCNSMIALAELATAGLGVTCLPDEYFRIYVQQGDLQILQCSVRPPELEYRAIYRSDIVSKRIMEIARGVYSFRHPRASRTDVGNKR
jgi:DNA-binding transcriptional LysR family regulator